MPYTGSCIPGEKIYVTVNGDIHMCERISPHFPIGTLDAGICHKTVAQYVNTFNKLYRKCHTCDITRICNICLARATDRHEIRIPADYCEKRYQSVKDTLIAYVDLMEARPNQLDKVVMSHYEDLRDKTGDILD